MSTTNVETSASEPLCNSVHTITKTIAYMTSIYWSPMLSPSSLGRTSHRSRDVLKPLWALPAVPALLRDTQDHNAVPRCEDESSEYWSSINESMLTLFMSHAWSWHLQRRTWCLVMNILSGWWFQTFFIFHFIYGIILPIDSYFSRWLLHRQPA